MVRVDEVAQVHAVTFGHGVVFLQQLSFARHKPVGKSLLFGCEPGGDGLSAVLLCSLHGALLVPVRLGEHGVEVLLHQPISALRGRDLSVDAHKVKRQFRDVHLRIDRFSEQGCVHPIVFQDRRLRAVLGVAGGKAEPRECHDGQ